MNAEVAKPGDTIEITRENGFIRRQFLVVECPDDHKNDTSNHYLTWVENQGRICSVETHHYKIILKGELKSNVGEDEFLKRQLNDNLRGIFG